MTLESQRLKILRF